VAVHGLGANPEKTWTYKPSLATNSGQENSWETEHDEKSTSTMWLKDLLPAQVPTARVLAFNYASEWLRDAPRESMRPLASRLLANLDDARQEFQVIIPENLRNELEANGFS
jgi:hypothetical protein